MTTGEKLKQQLGLSKFKSVKIARSLDGPIPIYAVVVDSKDFPITNSRFNRYPGKLNMYNGNSLPKRSSYIPLMAIEDFNANVRGRFFVVVDLAGSNLVNKNMYESVDVFEESRVDFYMFGRIDEFTIDDLKANAVSDITKGAFKKRQSEGNPGVTLESLEWSEKEDSLLLQYFVMPTFEQKVKTVNIKGNVKEDNHYEVELLFQDVSEYLGTKEDFLKLSKGDQIKKIRELLKNADVLVHSNDMSWWFQGGMEQASELDYEIYDFSGPKGKGIWSKRHAKGVTQPGIYISKHMLEVFQAVSASASDITQKIREG